MNNRLAPFKIYQENIDLRPILAANRNRRWAKSNFIRCLIKGLFIAASIFHMRSHMGVYAVNRKGTTQAGTKAQSGKGTK